MAKDDESSDVLPVTLTPAAPQGTVRVPREVMDSTLKSAGIPDGLAGLPMFFAMFAGEEHMPEGLDGMTAALADPSAALTLTFAVNGASPFVVEIS